MNDTAALSDLCTHLQGVAEQEKSDLARRLHDELGGLLTAAKMDLSWLQSRVQDAPIRERLAQLGNVLDEAMDLKRRMVDELRPSLLDHFGLPIALKAYVEAQCTRANIRCSASFAGDLEAVPKPLAIALFRVAQQGLDNILKHAQAEDVQLEFAIQPDGHYVLRLRDNGRGMNLKAPDFRWAHGLTGMRHRVEGLGGRFVIESNPGKGTLLTITVPPGATTSSGHLRRSP
jgi:signal transduction histidine kinase